MAPKYRLVYFDGRGRAELARILFAQAGVEYEDARIPKDKWPALKPNTPFGQLPVLEVNGKQIAQSAALTRYLATEFGLVGSNTLEAAEADMIVGACVDLFNIFKPYMFETDAEKKKEIGLKLMNEHLPNYMKHFERLLTANKGGKGYFVGDKLTWADIAVATAIHPLLERVPVALDDHPLLKEFYERIYGLPNIKAWIAKRPKTDF
ncbi:hypothetical protein CHUAL_002636 [Chamberlinius hualienensis]